MFDSIEENADKSAVPPFDASIEAFDQQIGEIKKVTDPDVPCDKSGDAVENMCECHQPIRFGKWVVKVEVCKFTVKMPCLAKECSKDRDIIQNSHTEGDNSDVPKTSCEIHVGKTKSTHTDLFHNIGYDPTHKDNPGKITVVDKVENGDHDDDGGQSAANFESNGCPYLDRRLTTHL